MGQHDNFMEHFDWKIAAQMPYLVHHHCDQLFPRFLPTRCHFRRKFDAEAGRLIQRISHPGKFFSAQFTPDRARIMSISEDTNSRIWDISTGSVLSTFKPNFAPTRAWNIIISPDGGQIALAHGGDDKWYKPSFKRWNVSLTGASWFSNKPAYKWSAVNHPEDSETPQAPTSWFRMSDSAE
jgi:WD40 repeat protein